MSFVASVCCICGRDLGTTRLSNHHLIPKSRGGGQLVLLHDICHAKIHHTFTNKELENYYHTPERIRDHAEMQKFINWVKNKPLSFYDKNDDTKARKRKR